MSRRRCRASNVGSTSTSARARRSAVARSLAKNAWRAAAWRTGAGAELQRRHPQEVLPAPGTGLLDGRGELPPQPPTPQAGELVADHVDEHRVGAGDLDAAVGARQHHESLVLERREL